MIAELVAVKGLGVWSAHMFLMFHLERPDVLPVGDLGIRRAVERAYGLRGAPRRPRDRAIAEPWRPHRTLACRYLWRSLDNEPARARRPAAFRRLRPLLLGHPEGGAAAAGGDDVGVLDLEAGALQASS